MERVRSLERQHAEPLRYSLPLGSGKSHKLFSLPYLEMLLEQGLPKLSDDALRAMGIEPPKAEPDGNSEPSAQPKKKSEG